MPVTPSEISKIKEDVRLIQDKDLQSIKDTLLFALRQTIDLGDTGKTLDKIVEKIVWIDCRLEGYSETGMSSWWFRSKSRLKYFKQHK
jgi:hypothetical protein